MTTLTPITAAQVTARVDTSFPLPALRPGDSQSTVTSKKPATVTSKSTSKTTTVTTSVVNGVSYKSVVVKKGDSLLGALARGGMSAADARRALAKVSAEIDARKLLPGDKLSMGFISDKKGKHLAVVRWSGKRGQSAQVVLLPQALQQAPATAVAATTPAPSTSPAPSTTGMVQKTLLVRGSPALPRALSTLGLPAEVSEQLMLALSQSRRPPVHGEMLTIAYLVPGDASTGAAAKLNYAAYKGRDGKQHILRYTAYAAPADLQQTDLMPAAMVALWDPLPGAKISSPFGWRMHPVFHTRLFHKGVDYEAHAGTPVMAAADGVVEDVGWRGNYGNYILIRHSGRLETAYAHLAGFASTTASGTHVRKGEIIGYVGTTGVATGPHLYYEVIVDGRQIDPEGNALKQATKAYLTQTAGIN